MNTEEIIEMARHADREWDCDRDMFEWLETFAEQVAAKEREACAKVCDARYMGDNSREDMEAKRCAKAIRARGNV